MKKHRKNHGNVLAVNAVCQRVLKVVRKALTKRTTRWTPFEWVPDRWTPFEGVPLSVFVADLRKRETPG